MSSNAFDQEYNTILRIADANGFSSEFIQNLNKKVLKKKFTSSLTSLTGSTDCLPMRFSLPYIPGLSESLRHLFKKLKICISFARPPNLATLLRQPLDSSDRLERSGVYKLNCSCGHFYIGKTLRSFKKRIHEHVRPLQLLKTKTNYTFNSNSSFAKHVLQSQHSPDIHNPEVDILHFSNTSCELDSLELIEILSAARSMPDFLLNDSIEYDASIFLKHFIRL